MTPLGLRLTAMSCAALVALSCGGVPATHYYLLQPQDLAPAAAAPAGEGLVVGVNAFDVDPPYDQDRIVYRLDGASHEVASYAYHRWAAPVSRMLPEFVAASLRGTPGIATIEPRQPGAAYTALLDGRVQSLEEIDTNEGQRVRVRLKLSLRDRGGELLWSEAISAEGLTRGRTVHDVVAEMSAALHDALSEAGDGLRQAIP